MKYFTNSPYERLMMEKPYADREKAAAPAKAPCGKCGYGAAKPCIAVCMRRLTGAGKIR